MTEIEIFRAGTHTDMAGQKLTFSTGDLAATAAAYDPGRHDAPIVIGHPATDDPAWGWVAALDARGDRLVAQVRDVDPAFAEAVQAGRYRKISAAFYRPGRGPMAEADAWTLRHVGFLDAMAPAVEGLAPVRFASDAPDDVAIFGAVAPCDQTPTTDEEERADMADDPAPGAEAGNEALHEQLAETRARLTAAEARFAAAEARAETARAIDAGIDAGRLLPAHRDWLVGFAARLDDQDAVAFADTGDTETARDGFLRWLGELPVAVSYGAHEDGAAPRDADDAEALAREAVAFQAAEAARGREVPVDAAIREVLNGREK